MAMESDSEPNSGEQSWARAPSSTGDGWAFLGEEGEEEEHELWRETAVPAGITCALNNCSRAQARLPSILRGVEKQNHWVVSAVYFTMRFVGCPCCGFVLCFVFKAVLSPVRRETRQLSQRQSSSLLAPTTKAVAYLLWKLQMHGWKTKSFNKWDILKYEKKTKFHVCIYLPSVLFRIYSLSVQKS